MFDQFLKPKHVLAEVSRELLEGKEYSFSEPWQFTSQSLSAVVPILQNKVRNREYLVAQEISGEKIRVDESGRIDELKVKIEDTGKPVFVRGGSIFKGQGTQSRTLSMGMILEPDKASSVNVFCVHASHGISGGTRFVMQSDVVPRKVEDVLSSPLKNQSQIWGVSGLRRTRAQVSSCPECHSTNLMQDYESDLICMNCGYVVAGVPRQNRSMNSFLSTRNAMADNLIANLDGMKEFNRKIDDMLSKIPADIDKQVGIVLIDSKGVYGLEMFDHPDSWRAFSKSIVRNYADVLVKERAGQGLFALQTERIPGAIKDFLAKTAHLSENIVFRNKISETRSLSGEITGEYSTLKDGLIHLILKRNEVTNNR